MDVEQIFIAITREDGGTSVMGFITLGRFSNLPRDPDPAEWADERGGWVRRQATDANIFAEISRVFSGPVPQPVKWRRVKKEDIPQDRTFRNALTDDGTRLHHPIEKCRPLHLEKLRRLRQPMLDQLDRDWMKATGQGDTAKAAEIEKERQRLRDVTKDPRIEAALTPDDLKKITLDND